MLLLADVTRTYPYVLPGFVLASIPVGFGVAGIWFFKESNTRRLHARKRQVQFEQGLAAKSPTVETSQLPSDVETSQLASDVDAARQRRIEEEHKLPFWTRRMCLVLLVYTM